MTVLLWSFKGNVFENYRIKLTLLQTDIIDMALFHHIPQTNVPFLLIKIN